MVTVTATATATIGSEKSPELQWQGAKGPAVWLSSRAEVWASGLARLGQLFRIKGWDFSAGWQLTWDRNSNPNDQTANLKPCTLHSDQKLMLAAYEQTSGEEE